MRGTNREIVQGWANVYDTEGKTNSGTIFFECNIIYSYGYHYPMANLYNSKEGMKTLINEDFYSPTTAKQKSLVVQYSRGELIFLPNPKKIEDPKNLEYLREQIRENHRSFKGSTLRKEINYKGTIRSINKYRWYLREIGKSEKEDVSINYEKLAEYEQARIEFEQERESRTVNDVLIPKKYWKKYQENTLKPKDIYSCRNAQVRAELLARLTYEKLLQQVDHEIIHEETRNDQPYILIRINTPKTQKSRDWQEEFDLPEDIMLLKVKCPSTGIYYVLRVPPRMKTCLEALAWTFDLSPEAYILEQET